MSDTTEISCGTTTTAPRWKRSQSLKLVYQLNAHCFELIADVAATDESLDCPLVSDHRELWVELDSEARRRMARLPFVILDLHFADEAWWRSAIDESTSAMHVHEPDSTNRLPRELSERLAHETLMFAWQMARTDRTATQVLFAMRASVAEMIGALTPGQVRDIAVRRSGGIQVRWNEDNRFWRDLLLAARCGKRRGHCRSSPSCEAASVWAPGPQQPAAHRAR